MYDCPKCGTEMERANPETRELVCPKCAGVNQTRAEFEAWWISIRGGEPLLNELLTDKNSLGEYAAIETVAAWLAWQHQAERIAELERQLADYSTFRAIALAAQDYVGARRGPGLEEIPSRRRLERLVDDYAAVLAAKKAEEKKRTAQPRRRCKRSTA